MLVWWLRPHLLVLFFITPLYLVLATLPVEVAGSSDYFKGVYVILGLAFLCCFAFSSAVGSAIAWSRRSTRPCRYELPPALLDVLAVLTLCAYVLWFWPLAGQPQLVAGLFSGSSFVIRAQLTTIAGITTFTQLGIVFVTVYGSALWIWRATVERRHHVEMGIIAFATLFRALAWSERLAILEVVVPLAVIYAATHPPRSRGLRFVYRLGPAIGLLGAIAVFAIFELFRSWAVFYSEYNSSYSDFVLQRFFNYYLTALNNGAAMLSLLDWPTLQMKYVLSWLHAFPIIGPHFTRLTGEAADYSDLLYWFGSEEFNNPSGIFTIFYDVGTAGALLFASIGGTFVGAMFRGFRYGLPLGTMLYPSLYIGILELMRIPYFTTGRYFPAFIGAIACAALLRKSPAIVRVYRSAGKPA